MKKLLITFALILTATWSFAADFTPTIMTLTTPENINYDFTGDPLTIPFTVTGTEASVWFIINTHGQSDDIVNIRNGFLGWHYVNKIDTTVYISSRYEREIGETNIVWDGTDQDGNILAAGTYDYYLWAYDSKTPRQMACEFIMTGFDWASQYTHIYELGADGLPLSNPILFGNVPFFINHRQNRDDEKIWQRHGYHLKWALGGDPHDVSLLQTTKCAMYPSSMEFKNATDQWLTKCEFGYGGPVLDPNDYNTFYHCSVNVPAKTTTMFKYQLVTDGEAVRDEDWLGWDELAWEDSGIAIGIWSQKPGCFTDRNYIYVLSPGLHQKELEWNKLNCVSFDGDVIFDRQLHEWYMPDDGNPHGYVNSAPHLMDSRGNNQWVICTHTSCLIEMINTTRILEDPEVDQEEYICFQNLNGDYWLDSAFEPDIEPAWYCLADDKTVSVRRGCLAVDSNNFTIISSNYSGIVSFGVATQDGTGIEGYMAYADDTVSDETSRKGGALLVDSGSNYDGLYMNSAVLPESTHYFDLGQANYVAFDSAHGIITNEPIIEPGVEDAPAAFNVGQNSPNPFNPTTSISFTILGADHVTVDIYNVAGQKIDTLVNDFMDAGKHSVVWDASGFSNGVYFYTVKSGDFSKTMKMTLLK